MSIPNENQESWSHQSSGIGISPQTIASLNLRDAIAAVTAVVVLTIMIVSVYFTLQSRIDRQANDIANIREIATRDREEKKLVLGELNQNIKDLTKVVGDLRDSFNRLDERSKIPH